MDPAIEDEIEKATDAILKNVISKQIKINNLYEYLHTQLQTYFEDYKVSYLIIAFNRADNKYRNCISYNRSKPKTHLSDGVNYTDVNCYVFNPFNILTTEIESKHTEVELTKLPGYSALNHISKLVIETFKESGEDVGYIQSKIERLSDISAFEAMFWASHQLDYEHQKILADKLELNVDGFKWVYSFMVKC